MYECIELAKRRKYCCYYYKYLLFYTPPSLKYHDLHDAENSISGPLDFNIFWGACPQTPLEPRTEGARI